MENNTQQSKRLQAIFLKDDEELKIFEHTISSARLNRYKATYKGNTRAAIDLYCSNSRLSQCLYLPMQIWEVSLRNKLNTFLVWKYGSNWPYDQHRALRDLQRNDKQKLQETLKRQELARNCCPVQTNAIVADLSAGFWVSLLTKGYEVPFKWRHNLSRIFPNDSTISRAEAATICENLLILRNRIAHHEPIYHLPLEDRRKELGKIIQAMCKASYAYTEFSCTFSFEMELLKEISN